MRLRILLFHTCFVVLFLSLLAACSDHDGGFQLSHPSSSPSPPPPPPLAAITLSSPARIAPFDADHLLVSDYESNYIYIVDKTTLQPTARIKVAGKSTGIALADGKIFVGNRTLRSVDVFDRQGNFLHRLGIGKAQFQQINDVDVDATRMVVYALDTKGKCIKQFNVDGSSAGTDIGVGTLQQPTALTVDPATGNILVSDFGNPGEAGVPARYDTLEKLPRIWIFDSSGNQTSALIATEVKDPALFGMYKQSFSTPQGITTSNGKILLVDTRSAEILVYDLTTLAWIDLMGGLGSGEGELYNPLDVHVDETTGDVFVADNRNARVTVFRGRMP